MTFSKSERRLFWQPIIYGLFFYFSTVCRIMQHITAKFFKIGINLRFRLRPSNSLFFRGTPPCSFLCACKSRIVSRRFLNTSRADTSPCIRSSIRTSSAASSRTLRSVRVSVLCWYFSSSFSRTWLPELLRPTVDTPLPVSLRNSSPRACL